MLEPGGKLCAAIGIGIILSILFWLFGWSIPAVISGGLTGILVLILIVLLAIEAHQDKVLYEDARKHDPEINRK
jgi:hypothetical protein